jgi:hypothetical protein
MRVKPGASNKAWAPRKLPFRTYIPISMMARIHAGL